MTSHRSQAERPGGSSKEGPPFMHRSVKKLRALSLVLVWLVAGLAFVGNGSSARGLAMAARQSWRRQDEE